jgi:hypothetical protein
MPTPDRTSVASQRVTLTVGGRSYSGFLEAAVGDHDLITGRYTPAGSKGDVVTFNPVRQGSMHTLTKKASQTEYEELKALSNPVGSMVRVTVDADGRPVGQSDRYTGVVKGVTKSGLSTSSADPLNMVVRFEADGEVG